MISANEIRQKYLKFFESRGHKIIPSAPLIPENDPTTLFTSSGMQPLVLNLLGQPHPSGTRLSRRLEITAIPHFLKCLAIGLWAIISKKNNWLGFTNF